MSGLTLISSSCSKKGGFRYQNEDTFKTGVIELKNGEQIRFHAVFDGHGGTSCSNYLQKHIIDVLHKHVKQYSDLGQLKQSIRDSIKDINQKFLNNSINDNTGSTGVLSFIYTTEDSQNHLLVANVGDSRAVLSRDNKTDLEVDPLTRDHNPRDPEEREYIESQGGQVFRGRIKGLNISRAFGDRDIIDHGLRCEPEFEHRFLIGDGTEIILLATDGVWHVSTNREAMEFVHEAKDDNLAEKLVDYALNKGSKDNVTAIVIRPQISN